MSELPAEIEAAIDAAREAHADADGHSDAKDEYAQAAHRRDADARSALVSAIDSDRERSRGELADTVPRSRYNAVCDEIAAANDKRKEIVGKATAEIERLEAQLSETRAERDAAVALVDEALTKVRKSTWPGWHARATVFRAADTKARDER